MTFPFLKILMVPDEDRAKDTAPVEYVIEAAARCLPPSPPVV
jgi:hypothetical protein